MKTVLFASAALLAATAAMPAFASDDDMDNTASCREVAKADWMSQDAARAKATEMGLTVKKLKVEDGCYELYAIDKDGKRIEAYMHPGTGKIVKSKIDS